MRELMYEDQRWSVWVDGPTLTDYILPVMVKVR